LAGNQLHQPGKTQITPPFLVETDQTQDGPMMTPQPFPPIGVAAVVVPALDTQHPLSIFGD
jgi:hypothetical protein